METSISFQLNGAQHSVTTESERPLLEVLREDLQMTGTKYGCGEGQCRACTVLVDGAPVQSCLTPAASVQGRSLETIEGLAEDESLHPVQEAFVQEAAMQCGYCTPGMVLSTVALLRRRPRPSDSEIVEALNGNLCRCCGYPNILAAARRAAGRADEAPARRGADATEGAR